MGAAQTAETALVGSTGGDLCHDDRPVLQHHLAAAPALSSAGPARVEFAPWFRVAVPIFLIEGFIFLLTNSDTVVTGLFLAPAEVAIYFAAVQDHGAGAVRLFLGQGGDRAAFLGAVRRR